MTINEIPESSSAEMEEAVPEQAGERQVRIGMFVIAGLIASIILLYRLTDPALFRGRYKITTTVENVMGLLKGDPVQMRGVTIGKVHSFEMARGGENVVVTLEVEGEWLIPEGSRTQIVSPGLMDPKTVEVLPGPGPGTIGKGGSLPGTAVKGLLDDTETLGEKGQVALDRIAELLSPKNLDAIGGSAQGLNTFVADLSELFESEKENVAELIQSLKSVADGLTEATGPEFREDLTNLAAGADSLVERLHGTSERVEGVVASLERILGRLENGEGTLGQLLVDDSLFTNLSETIENARLLIADIRENPRRYFSFNASVF